MYALTSSPSGAPVFLSAPGAVMQVLRQALAAHPRFFTSHLPCDCQALIEEWASTVTQLHTSRRPIWLSDAAFGCVGFLERHLPGARFVRVSSAACEACSNCLTLESQAVLDDPPSALAQILAFLGEDSAALARCA